MSEDEELEWAIQASLHRHNMEGSSSKRIRAHTQSSCHSDDNTDLHLAIAQSIEEAEHDRIAREHYDMAVARSIHDEEEIKAANEELDYAFALSLDDAMKVEVGFWLCNFCSFYSPPSNNDCIMCGSPNLQLNSSSSSQQLTALTPISALRKCALPGCQKSPIYFDYCTSEHRLRAQRKHMLPPAEDGVQTVFVGPTGEFTVHLLNKIHPDHSYVKNLFLSSWLKTEYGMPHVMRIYKLRNTPLVFEPFDDMGNRLGNIQPRFHGTSQHQDCDFGKQVNIPPCDRIDCRICSICRKSFSLSYCGQNAGTRMNLRYGDGLYFSPVSSKSHDYNGASEKILRHGDHRKRPWAWRSMFLCSVIVGRPYRTQEGQLPANICPPQGYDSVEGLVGKALNYDEVVVYHNHQAMPSHLIVYTLPP